MWVPFITPTTLDKPIRSLNLRIISISLCPIDAWIYVPNNQFLKDNILQKIYVYSLIVNFPQPYKLFVVL
jgi:hypothetical protein